MPAKILHILPRFTTGGAEKLVLEYSKQHDKNKIDLAVVAVRGGGELFSAFQASGDARIITNPLTLVSFVRRWHPEIIHTHIFSADCLGYLLKRLFPRIRWVSTQHNVEAQASPWRRFVWRRILRRADAVIAVSTAVEAWCVEGWQLPPARIHRIPNAIPLERFLRVPDLGATPPDVWEIATIGRLENQKGQDILLAALAALDEIPWHLSIFGEGSKKAQLISLSRSRSREKKIVFRGIADMADALRGVHIVVQPSRWEGRSLAVMESMVAGRCVVASDAAGADLIEDGKTGIRVPTADVRALADALRHLLTRPGEAARLGAAARMVAREQFSFDAWMRAMDDLYQSV